MTFEFRIIDSVEIFKDPIGHYHHWTCLVGRLVHGTMHLYDRICIPAVDGSRMCARVVGFEGKGMGSEVSCGQRADPVGVVVWSPAPSPREIALGAVTGSSAEEFLELVGWALRHRPARLIHDRGPNGLGLPCHDCTNVLYREGPVLHADFELALRDLCSYPDPYIAGRAQNIIRQCMSQEDYKNWRELREAAKHKSSRWKFWKHK
jgi:hypothetical protein